MRHAPFTTSVVIVVGITTAVAGALTARDDLPVPARFRSTVMVLDALPPGTAKVEIGGAGVPVGQNGAPQVQSPQPVGGATHPQGARPGPSSALLTISIDRWSTEEEKAAFVQTLKSGGTYALVSELEKATVGNLQVNNDLRWPIRWASTWKSEHGQVVRLATVGPILLARSAHPSRSTDYPIGIVEFTVPPSGAGEGSLVAATRAGFDDQGRIVALSLPIDAGEQRLTNVERETRTGGEGEK